MPEQPTNGQPASSILGSLSADELFARGMQSVKMTGAGGLTAWEPPTIDEAARLFPNYEVSELIGRGGMGAVYKARQLTLDRTVAIKLLPLEVSVDRDFAERFKREARTMAKMSHPNIVAVFDFGTTGEGHLFFVMEFIEGTTLHHLIKTTGLKAPQSLEIIVGVCEALNYAHAEGVVHRDIKPANILVDTRGRVKVTDFGLARMSGPTSAELAGYTMTGTVLGTPDYMAPEQKRGMHVDHRADIYSLGVMLYEMLCGNTPQGVFDLPSRLVTVDERVDQVVVRAMQQEPDRRYQNTAEMKHEVQTIRFAKDPNAKAPQPRFGTSAGGGAVEKKSRVPLIVGITAAAAAIAAGAIYFIKNGDDKKEQPTQPAAVVAPEKPAVAVATPTPVVVAVAPTVAPTPVPAPVVANTNPPPSVPPAVPAPDVTAIVPATTPPAPTLPVAPPPVRPVANPAMAEAVAQLGPNPTPVAPTTSDVLAKWQKLTDQGDLLTKRRDPDGALDAYQEALLEAEKSNPPAPALEIGRLYYKIGALEGGLGDVAEARGSLEEAKRVLLRARGAGKLGGDGGQLLGEIEATLRRLPRE